MYLDVFGVADNESIIRFPELEIADSRKRTKIWKKVDDKNKNIRSGVFGVADNVSVIRLL